MDYYDSNGTDLPSLRSQQFDRPGQTVLTVTFYYYQTETFYLPKKPTMIIPNATKLSRNASISCDLRLSILLRKPVSRCLELAPVHQFTWEAPLIKKRWRGTFNVFFSDFTSRGFFAKCKMQNFISLA